MQMRGKGVKRTRKPIASIEIGSIGITLYSKQSGILYIEEGGGIFHTLDKLETLLMKAGYSDAKITNVINRVDEV